MLTSDKVGGFPDREQVFPVNLITSEIVQAAIRLWQRYHISYWDGAILAAARELGASVVYSEDLAHGQVYDGVTVVNPFLPDIEQSTSRITRPR